MNQWEKLPDLDYESDDELDVTPDGTVYVNILDDSSNGVGGIINYNLYVK